MMTNASHTPHNAPASTGASSVYSITTASEAHTVDMKRRMIKYSVSMAIRVVCIILAVFLEGWLRWVAVGGAVILPWIAVLIANENDKADTGQMSSPVTEAARPALTAKPDTADDDVVLSGEVLDDEPTPPRSPDGAP